MKRTGEDVLTGDRHGDASSATAKRQRRRETRAESLGSGSGSDFRSESTPLRAPLDNIDIDITASLDHCADDDGTADVDHCTNASEDELRDDGLFVPVQEDGSSNTGLSASSIAATPDNENDAALICFGMIPNIKCQRLSITEHVVELDTAEGMEPSAYIRLTHLVKRTRVIVGTASCPELCHMNSKATFVLLEALRFAADLQLFVKRENLETFLHKDVEGKRDEHLLIDANIIGLDPVREDVGALLSKHAVYLQDPQCADEQRGYSNPHVLDLDVSQFDILFQELAMGLSAGSGKAAENTVWNTVLDDLPQQHNLGATAVQVDSAVVTTPAMPHQGEALDFMCKREIGGNHMDSDLRFWQLDRNEDGVPVYRHTVTADEKYHQQPEPQGGILADDMGLAFHFAQEVPNPADYETAPLTRCRATLVVVPSTQLMDSWTEELNKHTCIGTLKITKYHGHDRVHHFSKLLDNDIVLTTYGTIATEYRKTRREVLYHVRFFRIILDEAHTIRSRRTKLFKAVTTLDAAHHWCLTGTPISNRVDDLGALLDFCRVPLLGDSKCFQQNVTAITKKSVRRGYGVLKETLKPICLRRTRAILDILQPKSIEQEVILSLAERRQYDRIMQRSRKAIDDAVSGRTRGSTRNTMLKVLLELRIFCNQGTFTPESFDDLDHTLDADERLTLWEERGEAFCDVCRTNIAMVNQMDDPDSGALGRCSHKLCRPCYDDVDFEATNPKQYTCPKCEELTELEEISADSSNDEMVRPFTRHSSKMNKVVEGLRSSQNAAAPEKSIVFSVWRRTLNIAADLCEKNDIRYVRIDGKTPQSERSGILRRFTEDPSISALLMTMGTGALGLNITAASRIHILEPQWNPAVEDQAVGRIVRLGQARNATVVRYIVRDSVEKQIQGYQRRKMRLAAGGFEHRTEAVAPEDDVRLTREYLAQT